MASSMNGVAPTAYSPTAPSFYPGPSIAALKLQYVGKQVKDAQAPGAVLDAAVIRRNCKLMLDAAQKLDVGFRAHVKTHKTIEVTKLQVGETKDVRLICSTVSEIEHILPWLLQCKAQGRVVNVIYGLPLSLSAIPRLAAVARLLGEGSISLFADHPSHIKALAAVNEEAWVGQIPVWINIDVGEHREGVAADSAQLADIAYSLQATTRVRLAGIYTYMNSSYGSNSPEEALQYLAQELKGLEKGAISFLKSAGATTSKDPKADKVILSMGETPTVTATQNLVEGGGGTKQYREAIESIKRSFELELHAGVYPTLDMQQMATRARPQHSTADPNKTLLSYSDLGLRILAEVASTYPDRSERPEALIAAGSIALGREPCKSYSGWGVVTPWPKKSGDHFDPEGSKTGWIVGRVSQEHGVLTWEGDRSQVRQLQVGEKVMVWPNHACIAGVNFGWYLIVDSDTEDGDLIQDVWLRCRGW